MKTAIVGGGAAGFFLAIIMNGGVSDSDWASFQQNLSGKCNIAALQQVYQTAYDRYMGK